MSGFTYFQNTDNNPTAVSEANPLPTTSIINSAQLATISKDGTDATGVAAPTGAVGIRGWLSSIYSLLFSGTAKVINNGSTVTDIVFQSAVSAIGDGTPLTVSGVKNLTISITGTSTSRTIIFEEGDIDGNYTIIKGARRADLTLATQTTTTAEVWQFEVVGAHTFRTRISAIAGGTVTVKGKAVS